MKTLRKDELFQNLQGFLQSKGIRLTEGSYAQSIQKSCSALSEAINAGQHGIANAKSGIDRKLDQLRQIIHEKTAPAQTAGTGDTGHAGGAGHESATPPPRPKTPPKRKQPKKARKPR